MKNVVLDVKNMSVSFKQYEKGFHQRELEVIRDLNIHVHQGEMVAVIGASGSGKSLLAHAILGILPYNATLGGEMAYYDTPLTQERKEKLRGKEIVLVPQSVSYLDPLMKVGRQLDGEKKARKKKSIEIMSSFGLADRTKQLYPFELSGGMARRVLITTALMEKPKLVIADEPTPGLHIDVAQMVLKHFREMADDGAGVLLITHDLELAVKTADRVVVFYAGTTIEEADAIDFETQDTLRHPYTKALWRAMPQNGFEEILGNQPYVTEVPTGCPYRTRCEKVKKECEKDIPYTSVNGNYVRCIYGEKI